METLEEAKQYLRKNFEKGAKCPCCNQHVKLYRRTITSSMARGLVEIYKFFKEDTVGVEWLHIENHFKNLDIPASVRGDLPKLALWDLLEKMPGNRDDGSKRNGFYKITPLGKSFVEGVATVPKYKYIYNQEIIAISRQMDKISIKDCVKDFDYRSL